MKYKISKNKLPVIRNYLIEVDLEFHKEFEMNFEAEGLYSGKYVLEFYNQQDETAFLLAFDNTYYEKSNN